MSSNVSPATATTVIKRQLFSEGNKQAAIKKFLEAHGGQTLENLRGNFELINQISFIKEIIIQMVSSENNFSCHSLRYPINRITSGCDRLKEFSTERQREPSSTTWTMIPLRQSASNRLISRCKLVNGSQHRTGEVKGSVSRSGRNNSSELGKADRFRVATKQDLRNAALLPNHKKSKQHATR